jgi:hypothetical protein
VVIYELNRPEQVRVTALQPAIKALTPGE